jgi:very-short-patch-repair endonuclease
MTPAGQVLWASLRGRRVAGVKFRRQHGVGPFVLDFCSPDFKLAIEVDGSIHDQPEQIIHDQLRTEQLAAFGWRILRFRNEDVLHNHRIVIALIENAIATRTSIPHQRPSNE